MQEHANAKPIINACFITDLIHDEKLIEEYKEHHRNFWPELAEHKKKSGIKSLVLHNLVDRLVMFWVVEDDFDPTKEVKIPEDLKQLNQKWQNIMAKFQKHLPQANPEEVWVEMEKIFDLKDV